MGTMAQSTVAVGDGLDGVLHGGEGQELGARGAVRPAETWSGEGGPQGLFGERARRSQEADGPGSEKQRPGRRDTGQSGSAQPPGRQLTADPRAAVLLVGAFGPVGRLVVVEPEVGGGLRRGGLAACLVTGVRVRFRCVPRGSVVSGLVFTGAPVLAGGPAARCLVPAGGVAGGGRLRPVSVAGRLGQSLACRGVDHMVQGGVLAGLPVGGLPGGDIQRLPTLGRRRRGKLVQRGQALPFAPPVLPLQRPQSASGSLEPLRSSAVAGSSSVRFELVHPGRMVKGARARACSTASISSGASGMSGRPSLSSFTYMRAKSRLTTVVMTTPSSEAFRRATAVLCRPPRSW